MTLFSLLCFRLFKQAFGTKRQVRDFYKILNQVNTEEIPHGQLVYEMKISQYDASTFAFKLRAMVWLFPIFSDINLIFYTPPQSVGEITYNQIELNIFELAWWQRFCQGICQLITT
ncbi:probable galacturonosyltransferase 14 [Juglans regia]|uniref:Probable galacturonosyltransferase 14 n=1 Tax=Juglans regia TaxID=51240 RepID=A0A2I4HPW6_JUGRE|nr:probable galacturonosyltransferase 14 [Juglans regia]